MSGSRLQASGQLRNSFPYVVHTSVSISLSLVSGTLSPESKITYNRDIPFDRGPDKSGRVFIAFNGLFLRVSADSYASAVTLSGLVYYKTPEARKIYLTVIDAVFNANFSESNPGMLITPETSFNAERLNDIGMLGFENIGTSLGGASAITLSLYANIGFYGEYAETNITEVLEYLKHHDHYGLPEYSVQ